MKLDKNLELSQKTGDKKRPGMRRKNLTVKQFSKETLLTPVPIEVGVVGQNRIVGANLAVVNGLERSKFFVCSHIPRLPRGRLPVTTGSSLRFPLGSMPSWDVRDWKLSAQLQLCCGTDSILYIVLSMQILNGGTFDFLGVLTTESLNSCFVFGQILLFLSFSFAFL